MDFIDLNQIEEFILRYRPISPVWNIPERLSRFEENFERIKGEYVQIREVAASRALSEAPGFNIFSILGLSRNETRTHSAMLAHLFTPSAGHGQGLLFLESFLRHCQDRHADFPSIIDYQQGRWLVSTEGATQFGRLDIVIQNPVAGFLCVIENKIDAYEQTNQLQRYGTWMEKRRNLFPFQALCFLTIYGVTSATAGSHEYFRLSYREDITVWLDCTLPRIQAPGVLEIVRQYRDLVSRL